MVKVLWEAGESRCQGGEVWGGVSRHFLTYGRGLQLTIAVYRRQKQRERRSRCIKKERERRSCAFPSDSNHARGRCLTGRAYIVAAFSAVDLFYYYNNCILLHVGLSYLNLS